MGRGTQLEADLLARLPEVYAEVLRLRADGAGPSRLAEAAGVCPDAVILLVEVAERKLRRLAADGGGGATRM